MRHLIGDVGLDALGAVAAWLLPDDALSYTLRWGAILLALAVVLAAWSVWRPRRRRPQKLSDVLARRYGGTVPWGEPAARE